MLRYLTRRVAAAVVTFVAVTGICYYLFTIRGGRAIAFNILGPSATRGEIDLKVQQLGLDRPFVVQYLDWLSGLLRGDLGTSFVSNQRVTAIMSVRVPVTLSLVVMTLALTVVFGVLLGVLSAQRGGLLDRAVQAVSVAVQAVPGYWLALILVIVFGLNLGLFPATGFIPITESLTGWLSTIFLPSIAIALNAIFGLAVWIRSSIIDLQRQEWVRTLRSRGLSPRAIMYRHVLRNAAAPTVQLLGLMIIGLLGGAIIVERVFALPGIGLMALSSGQAGDVPVVLGAVTLMVGVVVIINILVDVANGFLTPKARIR